MKSTVTMEVLFSHKSNFLRRGSSIGCESAWYVDGRGFDPHVRTHSFVEIGHEIISMAILSHVVSNWGKNVH